VTEQKVYAGSQRGKNKPKQEVSGRTLLDY
jgi:hypothetical protein